MDPGSGGVQDLRGGVGVSDEEEESTYGGRGDGCGTERGESINGRWCIPHPPAPLNPTYFAIFPSQRGLG